MGLLVRDEDCKIIELLGSAKYEIIDLSIPGSGGVRASFRETTKVGSKELKLNYNRRYLEYKNNQKGIGRDRWITNSNTLLLKVFIDAWNPPKIFK